ncbi:hypothetical protein [Halolamina sp.]|jgi:hypothetical protein|uniref:DUF5789 family protein n=1 Tax=Halolamina sp. TaxID=1940283 RepID=UPI000223BA09|nr:hypothetical protein Halar_2265 [halophilic archaeon DL31]
MADDKNGREKQADDADKRQRKRDVAAELDRGDEPEPPVDSSALAYFDSELESLEFPVTASEVVAVIGDREIESDTESYTVEELVPEVESVTFDSPSAVRTRVQRPTVAVAMKRVLEAAETLPNTELRQSQHDAYEKTFLELKAVDADDDDEGILAITDWIVEQISEKESVPGSRAVRRQAAKFCRTNGYEIGNDEWLGI